MSEKKSTIKKYPQYDPATLLSTKDIATSSVGNFLPHNSGYVHGNEATVRRYSSKYEILNTWMSDGAGSPNVSTIFSVEVRMKLREMIRKSSLFSKSEKENNRIGKMLNNVCGVDDSKLDKYLMHNQDKDEITQDLFSILTKN